MTSFGGWLAARRLPRIALIAALLPMGVLSLVSTAIVNLTANLKGWQEAAADCLIAGGLLLLVTLFANGQWQALVISAALIWPMAIVLGAVTGRFGTLILPMQLLVLTIAAGVIAFSLAIADPAEFWQEILAGLAAQLQEAGWELGDSAALRPLAPLMTGILAASLLSSLAVSALLGTWWAASAGGPGLGDMFRALRLGAVVGIAAALAGLARLTGLGPLADNLLLVFGVAFCLQGLAVLHWQVHTRRWPPAILLFAYAPLLFGAGVAATTMLSLAAVGFVDNWYSLRRVGADVIK